MNFEIKKYIAIISFTDFIWHVHKRKNLTNSARSFQVGVHFQPGYSQPATFINSFCAKQCLLKYGYHGNAKWFGAGNVAPNCCQINFRKSHQVWWRLLQYQQKSY